MPSDRPWYWCPWCRERWSAVHARVCAVLAEQPGALADAWKAETDEIRARESARLDGILRWMRTLDGAQDPRRLANEIEATSAVPPAPATVRCLDVGCACSTPVRSEPAAFVVVVPAPGDRCGNTRMIATIDGPVPCPGCRACA